VRRALTALLVSTVAGLTLTACTSGGGGTGPSSSAAAPTSASASNPSPSAPAPSTPPATSPAPSSSMVPSSPPASSSKAPAGPAACATKALTVHVLRGGAEPGVELALIIFTNSSKSPCSLFGHPGVSLRSKNALLVTATYPSNSTAKTVVLAPGGQAQTTIHEYSSTCQASLSDTVRIYPPNLRTFVDAPLVLRGCRLTVAPVEAA
jgi:hypothetical protein